MPHFGQRSLDKLSTCHPDLIRLFKAVVEGFDCTVIEGHRSEGLQRDMHARGLTKLLWPHSLHNRTPSHAADVAPYPIDWRDTARFYFFAGYVKGIAESMEIPLRWGGDWDSDTQVKDQSFMDLVHYELRGAS